MHGTCLIFERNEAYLNFSRWNVLLYRYKSCYEIGIEAYVPGESASRAENHMDVLWLTGSELGAMKRNIWEFLPCSRKFVVAEVNVAPLQEFHAKTSVSDKMISSLTEASVP